MAETEPAAMQAGVVNVLLTVNPVASHAAGTYVTWDGVAFDEEQIARCDAATPHELWAWTVTTGETPGAAAEPRADVPRLTTIVAGASGQAPEAFNDAVIAHFASCPARDVWARGPGTRGQTGTAPTRSSSARPCCRGSSATRSCPAWPGRTAMRHWRSWRAWTLRPARQPRTLQPEAPGARLRTTAVPGPWPEPASGGRPPPERSVRRLPPGRRRPRRSAGAAACRPGRGDIRGYAPVPVKPQVPGSEFPVSAVVDQGLGRALRLRGPAVQGHPDHRGLPGHGDVADRVDIPLAARAAPVTATQASSMACRAGALSIW